MEKADTKEATRDSRDSKVAARDTQTPRDSKAKAKEKTKDSRDMARETHSMGIATPVGALVTRAGTARILARDSAAIATAVESKATKAGIAPKEREKVVKG